mgnify:CR=1 FL=1|jgi:hypothetical protein|tara:strand:+ start:215 stop:913 length:699 start_codon:yes stop_codon:yes gene_type:complete
MKKIQVFFILLIFFSCNQKSEWIYLFDGETTNGWRGYNSEIMPPGWIVKDGVLNFQTEKRLEKEYKGGRDIVYSIEEFENFEFYIEWKLPEGGNSGIHYHLKEGYSTPSIVSPEYQLIDDLKWGIINNDTLQDWQKTASDYAMYTAEGNNKIVKAAGEWNTSKIIFTQMKVEHWLNGKMVLSFVPWSDDWYERKSIGKWKNSPDYGKFKKGLIALQDHDSPLAFREIKIKKL